MKNLPKSKTKICTHCEEDLQELQKAAWYLNRRIQKMKKDTK
jgi:hypothetical protein